MDVRKIKKLIEMLEASGLSEIEISEGEESIRLSRTTPTVAGAQQASKAPASSDQAVAATSAPPVPATVEPTELLQEGLVLSPMVGTFYASANPDSPPYVEVGSEVAVGDVLCVIEAMKIFNHVEAEISGVVRRILKHSGDPVQYGEALFMIEEQGL
ncbi:MAG: acetyl-CoA carboxylase biotin carboxyl carrier protein [Arenicellales bacterium]|jgi:acetyl-CoA carboxylase biotin carboxyl carrier protein|nr:acetyl-CoA carboxylase biotin carboxyl carrier protein [Arenicellales bacterium]